MISPPVALRISSAAFSNLSLLLNIQYKKHSRTIRGCIYVKQYLLLIIVALTPCRTIASTIPLQIPLPPPEQRRTLPEKRFLLKISVVSTGSFGMSVKSNKVGAEQIRLKCGVGSVLWDLQVCNT
jgi:hypothetical protein